MDARTREIWWQGFSGRLTASPRDGHNNARTRGWNWSTGDWTDGRRLITLNATCARGRRAVGIGELWFVAFVGAVELPHWQDEGVRDDDLMISV